MVYSRQKEKSKGMNEFDSSSETNVTDPIKDQPDVTVTDPWFSEDYVAVEDNNEGKMESVPEYHPSVPPSNIDRANANPEYLPIIQHRINIPEVTTTSWKVFTPEHNELFVQRIVQDTQGLEGKILYYHILGLN